ncbi:MAG TPA: TonB-dependent receptor [Sphingomonas sp.]|uniref:TonB-dependent receptor n=1 Tax=Sphingomonas sp. TaxID=28214 RepID=UPI002B98DD54|nr:TonB-dependent receptor [Sphingomonas sp.]HMI21187.1 TonB-dependent receptor [Sphingomonas sp.]
MFAAASPVMAQSTVTDTTSTGAAASDSPGGPKEITITGIRASLANAQSIKRNSDTVVDAITAQDIGALPDRSVTEALQRVPGVAMNRFAGSNDPDHFSVEGSGIVVRGLTFVRSEFNGRDTFSAGVGGQAINFADVPAELLGSVEVYKNTTAEMIEGGLAGTVNLNTRKPFDSKGFHIGFDMEGTYGDLEKRLSPTWSFLISDTWDTGIGRVGLLGAASFSQIRSRSNGLNVTNIQTRDNTLAVQANSTTTLVCRNPLPGTTNTTTLPPSGSACGTASTPGADGFLDPAATLYAPVGGQFREEDYNRKRRGVSFGAQWESVDRRALLTAQFLHTASENAWGEHTFETGPDLAEYNTYPAGCVQNGDGPGGVTRAECPTGSTQNYTYDDNGLFEKGYITLPGTGWRNSTSGSSTTRVPTGGQQQSLSRRQVDEKSRVTDYGLNFKFNPDDHWAINLDADYTKAEHDNLDVSVFGSTFADNYLDISGGLPTIIPHKPMTLSAGWATPNPIVAGETDSQYFADRSNEFWRAAMDHIEHSTGHEWSGKADIAYNFGGDDPFLKRLKFGARYADREEVVRYTTYNWGALSEVWAGNQVSMQQIGDRASLYTFDNFFRGDAAGPPAAYYYNGDLIKNYADATKYLQNIGAAWTAQGGSATPWTPAGKRAGVVAGGPYLPSEIQPVSEKSKDAYAMLSFGRDEPLFGGIKVDGNIGVRYVADSIVSTGSIGAPTAAQLGVTDSFAVRCPTPTLPPGVPPGTPLPVPTGVCAQGAANYALLQQFATGQTTTNTARNKYHYFLPSLNLKFGLSRDMLIRVAASRVMTRPDLANIRNFVSISLSGDGSALSSNAGNPYLKPALANQFDLTYEWYFARVGSLTIDAFYKDVTNFFYQNVFTRTITSNGVTLGTQVRGPDNYHGHGKIKGVEAAYQQTFDFLPGVFSGLGTQLSYTYLQSKGLPNSFLNGGAAANNSPIPAGKLPLEQLSKHNVNAEIFYEKGPISLRAAYTWRSRFLLTATDVIFPYYPIYNAAEGHLDASVFLTLSKGLRIGVQGVNLNNEVTKTLQQYTTSGLIGPRSYFTEDRRYSFIVRGSW